MTINGCRAPHAPDPTPQSCPGMQCGPSVGLAFPRASGALRACALPESSSRKVAGRPALPRLQLAMQRFWDIAQLDHLRHVRTIIACAVHVEGWEVPIPLSLGSIAAGPSYFYRAEKVEFDVYSRALETLSNQQRSIETPVYRRPARARTS
jgi:hypothetical protein